MARQVQQDLRRLPLDDTPEQHAGDHQRQSGPGVTGQRGGDARADDGDGDRRGVGARGDEALRQRRVDDDEKAAARQAIAEFLVGQSIVVSNALGVAV
jgi:hypothetical protein